MDGFFVAKFKVSKKAKKSANNASLKEEEEPVQMMLDGDGEKVPVGGDGDATFNEDEDRELIRGESLFRADLLTGPTRSWTDDL